MDPLIDTLIQNKVYVSPDGYIHLFDFAEKIILSKNPTSYVGNIKNK